MSRWVGIVGTSKNWEAARPLEVPGMLNPGSHSRLHSPPIEYGAVYLLALSSPELHLSVLGKKGSHFQRELDAAAFFA